MLCEQCQLREATVHFSALSWPSGEVTRHLCGNCYPDAEAERTASYGPERKALPVIDVEHITAVEYLDFAVRAQANSADAPAYRHISNELERFPVTRERLALEILTMAWQALERGNDAWLLIVLGGCFGNSVPPPNAPTFIELLEKITRRSAELMAQSANAPTEHPFGFGLTLAATALRTADDMRFSTLLEELKAHHPSMREIIDYVERKIAESDQWRGRERGGNV